MSDLFNAFYKLMLITMQDLFSGGGAQGAMVDRLYGLMSGCLALAACCLVRQPIDGARTAGPTFEPHRFGADPWGEAAELAQAVSVDLSELTDVAAEASAWAVST